ncbi:MAG: hypothetical protein ACSLE8_06410 [Rhodococcus sp. (in: high G+C Gram-positive bacteria)]
MDDADDMLDDCENRSERLSDWELGFIDSLKAQRYEGKSLTQSQYDKLEEVWRRATAKG